MGQQMGEGRARKRFSACQVRSSVATCEFGHQVHTSTGRRAQGGMEMLGAYRGCAALQATANLGN